MSECLFPYKDRLYHVIPKDVNDWEVANALSAILERVTNDTLARYGELDLGLLQKWER